MLVGQNRWDKGEHVYKIRSGKQAKASTRKAPGARVKCCLGSYLHVIRLDCALGINKAFRKLLLLPSGSSDKYGKAANYSGPLEPLDRSQKCPIKGRIPSHGVKCILLGT